MPLTKFGFIVTGNELTPETHRMVMSSKSFEMTVIGISEPSQGPNVAKSLVDDGIQLIEICGGFGPIWAAKIIEAINGKVPVGSVAYGPEAITPMHKLFQKV